MTDITCKAKKMWLYFVFLTTVKAIEIEYRIWESLQHNNGWTPISRDRLYNSFNEKSILRRDDKETLDQNTNELIHSHLKYADPESTNKLTQSRYLEFDDKLISNESSPNFLPDYNVGEDTKNMVKLNTINNRQAKAISNKGFDVINIITKQDTSIVQTDTNYETKQVTVKHGNQYQVTENQEQKEHSQNLNSDVTKPLINEPSTKHYDVVDGRIEANADKNSNEFTNKFLDILSSYNIRVNDVLTNYELSRHSNPNPIREYIMVPIPIRLANRFNSRNHLPFDPLLAVFLSNFGYYLPGHYGVNNKYYNLYGNLASNNIHNNEPFGSYNIFPDTDLSN